MIRPLEPGLKETIAALVNGLAYANVRFCLVGALVPELLLKTPPPRRTNDADVVIQVETLQDFEHVKDVLVLDRFGFARGRGPFRLERGTGRVDVLPYSEALAPDGRLRIPPSTPYNMLGFDKVHQAQTRVTLDDGPTVPLITIPLYALLKIVAYTDRSEARDPAGVLHCLHSYEEDSERLYGVEHEGALVDYDVAGAYLLGYDSRALIDPPMATLINPVLTTMSDPDSPLGFRTVREYHGGASSDRWRLETARLFKAYRDGLGI